MKEAQRKIKRMNRFFAAIILIALGFAIERLGVSSALKKYGPSIKKAQADAPDCVTSDCGIGGSECGECFHMNECYNGLDCPADCNSFDCSADCSGDW